MKYCVTIFITFFSAILSFGQASKEQDFVTTLEKVVKALSTRDSVTLSQYVDMKTGVYILSRIGIFNSLKQFSTLGFSEATYPNVPFYDSVKLTKLRYSKLPTFDCEKWSKTGTFVDTAQTDHLLSDIAKRLNTEIEGSVSTSKINEYTNLEHKSRRIIIADNSGNELIIYLSYIKKKWMLTIIDKVTCDCST